MSISSTLQKLLTIATTLLFLAFIPTDGSFKKDQLRYPRVRAAYHQKEDLLKKQLKEKDLQLTKIQLYLRAFKQEKELEIWGRNTNNSSFKLFKTYKICATSGTLGPKRKQGDRQIPEGFYHINRFNPASNFHLSLGINYPNKSDRILSDQLKPGGDIFIHGSCVTIGCLPMTDNQIKEIYVLCVEAKDGGQNTIPVTIFPFRMSRDRLDQYSSHLSSSDPTVILWKELQKGFALFNQSKKLPHVGFLKDGRHNLY